MNYVNINVKVNLRSNFVLKINVRLPYTEESTGKKMAHTSI